VRISAQWMADRLPDASGRVDAAVLGALTGQQWQAYMRERCAVRRVMAVRLGQKVRRR
jgi:hypothetical protein